MKADKTNRESQAAAWLGILFLLPALYILSVGPYVYLSGKSYLPPSAVKIMDEGYYPLLNLCEKSPLEAPLEAYMFWWYRLGARGTTGCF